MQAFKGNYLPLVQSAPSWCKVTLMWAAFPDITNLIQHWVLTPSIRPGLTKDFWTSDHNRISRYDFMWLVFSITCLFLTHKKKSCKSLSHCGRCNNIIRAPRTGRKTGEQTHLSWKVQPPCLQPFFSHLVQWNVSTHWPFSSFFLIKELNILCCIETCTS